MRSPLIRTRPPTRFNANHSQLRFKKHYFWLGDETAVPHSELAHYLGSKEADKHTAAHSSHTGKGLLYFKEGESTKSKPQGIINLVR